MWEAVSTAGKEPNSRNVLVKFRSKAYSHKPRMLRNTTCLRRIGWVEAVKAEWRQSRSSLARADRFCIRLALGCDGSFDGSYTVITNLAFMLLSWS